MNLTLPHKQNPLLHSPILLTQTAQNPPILFQLPTNQRPRISRKKTIFRIYSSANANGSDGFSWSSLTRSVRLGTERFLLKLGESVKKETGFDVEGGNVKVGEFVERIKGDIKKGDAALTRFRTGLLTDFMDWNRWERWKDFKNWEPKRVGALLLYIFAVMFACQRIYVAIRAPFLDQERRELTEAYMEALIPEPSPINIRKFKKGMWRNTTPKGLKMKKFIEGPDGTLIQDTSYVGEDAWEDDQEPPQENMNQIIDKDVRLNAELKKNLKEDLGILGEVQDSKGTWRERLHIWKEVLKKEKFAEQLDSSNAKYVVEFDMKEVENSLRKDVVEKVTDTQGARALWISKRWWRYRPKLPYTYFLQKLDSSEASVILRDVVAAVVFTEDLKRLYVTMKEGFPLEYVVDIPLDPYLFEVISGSGVEVDLLQKRQIHYFLKVLIALMPGLLILWLIREAAMLLHITSKRFLYKKYNQLFDMAYAENFILPVGDVGETKTMYKEVVLGGDVWDLLDEIMIYMGNPMQYYERGVKFVRGVLLSGPPGTGKTLFARTLAKESGLPFVFASGAEFTDSEKSGAARINEMFSIARRNVTRGYSIDVLPGTASHRWFSSLLIEGILFKMEFRVPSLDIYPFLKIEAPCFVFVDEIDAIAGRHARKDPRRRATFEALIAQLDGEKEKTGVDRFSLRQAVIFICATNRPDELDLEFVRPGRIDRRLYIGLPDAKQRVQIFGVHSIGKQLAEDVDFGKLVFRTVGFSGADIRNLVNEAAIMSVRKGHSKVYQQDLVDVLDKQLLEGMGVLLTEEEQQKCEQNVSFEKKSLLAVHEAGHIVLSHLFPRFDWHAFSQLLPGGKETAISVFYPREDMIDQGYTTFGYMKMQMVVAHGGRCAERLVYGEDITDGGSDDLEKITKWDDPHVIPANMTLEVSELFTREMTRYVEETEELAMEGLRNNRHILDVITKELLEKSRITGLEVEDLMKELSPTMFEDFVKPFQINLDELLLDDNFCSPEMFVVSLLKIVNLCQSWYLRRQNQQEIKKGFIHGHPRRHRECIAVGPTVMGYYFGRTSDDLFHTSIPNQVLSSLSKIGYILFVFFAGVQMDTTLIWKTGRKAFSLGAFVFATSFIMASCVAIYFPKDNGLTIGIKGGMIFTGNMYFESMIQTEFVGVCYILMQLQIINSQLGRLALASSMHYKLMSLVYNITNGFGRGLRTTSIRVGVQMVILSLAYILFIVIVLRQMIFTFIRITPQGQPLKEIYATITMACVFLLASSGDCVGLNYVFGPLILGLIVPARSPLAEILVQKFNTAASGFLLPLMTMFCASKIDLHQFISEFHTLVAFKISLIGFAIKLAVTFLGVYFYKLPLRHAAALTVILNAKGHYEVGTFISFNPLKPLLVKTLYHPAEHYVSYKQKTIEHVSNDAELQILVCAHREEDAVAAVTLLEYSNPTKQNPLSIYGLCLEELVSSFIPVLINHQLGQKISYSEGSRSQPIIDIFKYFKTQHNKFVQMHVFTAISPFKQMHEDICWLSFDKDCSLVIIPFHKKWNSKGKMVSSNTDLRNLNINVLKNAPCSVGTLIDRKRAQGLSSIFSTSATYRVAALFVGGSDDREAISYALRMARSPRVHLTIMHLVAHNDDVHNWENMVNDDFLRKVKAEMSGHTNIDYIEETVRDGSDTSEVLQSIVEDRDLIMVGRQHENEPQALAGLSAEWIDFPELGPMGDLLASEYISNPVSVLVVQQQKKKVNVTASN
ncbi:hypothetical protein POTOM_036463 [Populus tomentosa]|uniref:AAA+ ATPase domain-containing protein n=1 Tax=Populus tomentosa TaxID=118781 RepID=A0A8X8CF25_POPTO|nr:hypothetical protein POTOM_036463 [Populus tomentosa]